MNTKSKYMKLMVLGGFVLLLGLLGTSSAFKSTNIISTHPFLQKLLSQLDTYTNETADEKLYIQTNQTLLQPGETLWFNAFIRDAKTLKKSKRSEIVYVEFLNPTGGIIKKLTLLTDEGSANGDFHLPDNLSGGLYKIKGYTQWMQNTKSIFEKDIQVQNSVLPNLNMKLEFERKGFGAGDEVVAKLNLNTLENKPLGNQSFKYTIKLDGENFQTLESKTGSSGRAYIKFRLPSKLDSPDGLLNVRIAYNGQTESISRSVPIVLNKIDLQFFPEGGDLVAGVNSKLGFKGSNEQGKASDVEGIIIDNAGNTVTEFKSYYQGMGAVEFTPKKGKKYYAKITRPIGITEKYVIPPHFDRGFGIHVKEQNKNSLKVAVSSTHEEDLYLVAQAHGQIYYAEDIPNVKGSVEKEILLKDLPVGLLQITLFDSNKMPRSERLAFVNKHKQLHIEVSTDKQKYLPREKVQMTVKVTDERGLPTPGKFSLAVVDSKQLSFADDKQVNILSQILLQSDLKGNVEEPNFYFEKNEGEFFSKIDRSQALDNLLLTQGWRRFAWEDILDNTIPNYVYNGERKEVGGIIVDKRGQPINDALVTIPGQRLSQRTGKDGLFLFKDIDLKLSKQMQVYTGFTVNQPITDYRSNYRIVNIEKCAPCKIKGIVKDENGEVLPFATIIVKGTSIGVKTDFDGQFAINLPEGTSTISIQHIGYDYKEVNVDTDPSVNFTRPLELTLQNQVLINEVTVTALNIERETRTLAMGAPIRQDVKQIQRLDGAKKRKGKRFKNKAKRKAPKVIAPPEPTEEAIFNEIDEEEKEVFQVNDDATDLPVEDLIVAEEVEEIVEVEPELLKFEKSATAVINQRDRNRIMSGMAKDQYREVIRTYSVSREFYAPVYKAEEVVENRTDFRTTVYWNPNVVVGRNGYTTLEFYNCDAISEFTASIEGFSKNGQIGRSTAKFFTQMPFGMVAKAPSEALTGDQLLLPITLMNNTNRILKGKLDISFPKQLIANGEIPKTINLKPGESKTIYLDCKVSDEPSTDLLSVSFNANGVKDVFSQKIKTAPRGFPVDEVFAGDQLNQSFDVDVQMPVEGSIEAYVTAYPSFLEETMSGLDKMLRQPGGCFEQTSSGNYPNILALQYLRGSGQINPEIEKMAQNYLDYGYKRLLTFEIKGGGFDIWGRGPAHEGLSAYGLIQFHDMKSVYPVSEKLLDRTAKWILSRKLGNGGWNHENHAGHGFVSDPAIGDAYMVYALTESGYYTGFDKEIEKSYNDAVKSEDPYLMALAANVLLNIKDKRAKDLLNDLVKRQDKDGSFTGTQYSITHSTGHGLKIETTSLVAMALLKAKSHRDIVKKSMKFIQNGKTNYGFGSTQSTVMALRAMAQFAKDGAQTKSSGTLAVYIEGKKVGEANYKKDHENNIEIKGLEQYLTVGRQQVEVKFEQTGEALPFDFELHYTTRLPVNKVACPFTFTTKVNTEKVEMGETVRLEATMLNNTKEQLASPMIMVGIPAGLSLQPWQLKELQDKEVFDYYELYEGYAVFHYRKLDPEAVKTVKLDLKADIPGTFEAPASNAFLYYSNEQKIWSKPEAIKIKSTNS